MQFFSYIGEYLVIMWQWIDYPINVLDFTYRPWQIAMFLFILDIILNLIGLKVREDYQVEKSWRMHKKYELKRNQEKSGGTK